MFSDTEVALISQEVDDLTSCYDTVAITVESLEGRVRSEVSNSAQSRASCFEALFTVTESDEEILQSVF